MNSLFSRDLCAALVLSFGHFLWIGTLIAIVAAISVRRQRTAEARYRVWLAALVALVVSPFVTLAILMSTPSAMPAIDAPAQRSQPNDALPAEPADEPRRMGTPARPFADEVGRIAKEEGRAGVPILQAEADRAADEPTRSKPAASEPAPRESAWWRDYAPLVTSLYLIGVALMGLRLALGLWGGRRLRNRAALITERSLLDALQRQADALGMKLVPALAYCERVAVPTVLGILKPMILLPVSLASGLAPDQIESVLAHELAHLRRYDHLVNLMQCVIESVLFFHPAVWWVSRRVRDEREHCCDDLVIACGAVPLDYAASLLRVAELSRETERQRGHNQRRSFTAVSLFATGDRPSTLRQRIARLLGYQTELNVRAVSPWVLFCLATCCVGAIWLLSSMTMVVIAEINRDRSQKTVIVTWSAIVDDSVMNEIRAINGLSTLGTGAMQTPADAKFSALRCSADDLRAILKNHADNKRLVALQKNIRHSMPTGGWRIGAEKRFFQMIDSETILGTVVQNPPYHVNWHADGHETRDEDSDRARLIVEGKYHFTQQGEFPELDAKDAKVSSAAPKPFSGTAASEVKVKFDSAMSDGEATLVVLSPPAVTRQYQDFVMDDKGGHFDAKTKQAPRLHAIFVHEAVRVPVKQLDQFHKLTRVEDWVRRGPGETKEHVTRIAEWQARPSRSVSATDAQWTRDLPNGGHVQLVGLGRPNEARMIWWTPDGEPLSQISDTLGQSLTGMELAAIVRVWEDGVSRKLPPPKGMVHSGGVMDVPDTFPSPGSQLLTFPAVLDKATGKVSLKVGAGFGGWSPEVTIEAAEESKATLNGIEVKTGTSHEHQTFGPAGPPKFIPVTGTWFHFQPRRDFEFDAVAVSREGRMLTSTVDPIVTENDKGQNAQHFTHPLPKANLKQFLIKSRLIHWTEFTDFATEPAVALVPPLEFGKEHEQDAKPFSAKLPGGVTVNLVGVGMPPTQPSEWWQADGSPLAKRPNESLDGYHSNGFPNQADCREFALEILGLPQDHSVTARVGNNVAGVAFSNSQKGVKAYNVASGPFSGVETTSVQVSLRLEPLGPPQGIDAEGRKLAEVEVPLDLKPLYDRVQPIRVESRNDHQELLLKPLGDLLVNPDWRIFAIDTNGKQVRPSTTTTNGEGTTYGFKLARENLARFEYHLRLYRHSVTFENVSLHPGKKSEVKVTVASAPKPERYVANLSDGRSIEFVGITKNTAPANEGWKPDGTPIGDVGYWPATIVLHSANSKSFSSSTFEENGPHPEPDPEAIDAMFRFQGLKEQPSLSFNMATNGSSYSHLPLKHPYDLRVSTRRRGEPTPGGAWSIPDGEYRVGLTDEPWGKWVQVSPDGKILNPLTEGDVHKSSYEQVQIRGVEPYERAPNKQVLVLRQPQVASTLYSFEIRGVDEDGKPQWVLEWEGRGVEGGDLNQGHWGLASSETKPLARYEFRVRPYRHRVTFTGVSLEPGKASDVKVKVESIGTSPPDEARVEPAPKRILFKEAKELVEGLGGQCYGDNNSDEPDARVQLNGKKVDDVTIRKLAGYPKLTSLWLYGMVSVTDDGLAALAHCTSLDNLQLQAPAVTDVGGKHLARLNKLKFLTLSNTKLTDEGLRHLATLPQLTDFSIWSDDVGDAGMQHLARMTSLKNLSSYCPKVTNDGLKTLAQSASLESLHFSSDHVSDEGMAHLVNLKSLRSLAASGVRLTDESLKTIGTFANLEYLSLSGTVITDAGMEHLKGLKKVDRLHFHGNRSITGEGLSHLHELPLKQFTLMGPSTSDKGLEQLAAFPQITHLAVGFGGQARRKNEAYLLTDEGLKHLAAMPALAYLSFDGAAITDAGVVVLKQASLKSVLCLRCPQLTAAGKKAWQAAAPHVQITGNFPEPRAERAAPNPAPALDPAAGLPNSDKETKTSNNTNADPQSNSAAGSGDPRRAQADDKSVVEVFQIFSAENLPVEDVSDIRDPDQLLDQLEKGPRVSHFLMTGGGIFWQPGTPPQSWQVELWNQRFAGDKQLDPRVRQLIKLGDSARSKVQQRLAAAKPQIQSHLALMLRSTGKAESIPVLIQSLKDLSKSEQLAMESQSAMSMIAVTSALWELTGRKHLFTPKEWDQWWDGVKADFVVSRDRQRPEVSARVTKDRVQALVVELAMEEEIARERLIALGPAAVPHLLESLQGELKREPAKATAKPVAARPMSHRVAWVIDELGATDKLPASLRRDYFTQRFSDSGTHTGLYPIDEDALSRALSHCSFTDYCSIFLEADSQAVVAPHMTHLKWPHDLYAGYCRRFNKLSPPNLGGWTSNPHWTKVVPAEDPAEEISGALPVLLAALKDERVERRVSASKLADAIGFCSTAKPEILIIALRDAWLVEADEKVRPQFASAMCRFGTPFVVKEISNGLLSDRPEIVSDCAALMDSIPIELNDETRFAFERLVELTRHENDRVRRSATRSLAYKAPQLLGPEFERLCTDKVQDIREACTLALRSNPDPKHADILFKLADDAEQTIRESAFSSIGNLRHPESMSRLIPHLRDPKVHGYAVSALASMGGNDALPLMMDELKAGNDVGGMVYQHLRRLTGETFEEKPEPWLAWWKQQKPATKPNKDSAANSPREGLDFLKPYPKLHGLSLDMTEPRFLEIVKQQELKTRTTVESKTGEGEKVTHRIALGDDHTLIVMFDKDAKCSGIQRVRGEDSDRPAELPIPSRPKPRPDDKKSAEKPANSGVQAILPPLEFRFAAQPADSKFEPRVPADYEKRDYSGNSVIGRMVAKDKGFIWVGVGEPKDGIAALPVERLRGGQVREVLLADTPEHTLAWNGKWSVEACRVVADPNNADRSIITLKLNEAGGEALRALTKSHLNQPLAILVNNEIITAPIVREEFGRDIAITGNFTREQADKLAAKVVILPAKKDGEQPKDAPQGEAKNGPQVEKRVTQEEVFARRVSLDVKEVPLREALAKLARAAKVELLLEEDAIKQAHFDLEKPVTVAIDDEPLGEALIQLIPFDTQNGVIRALRGGKLVLTTIKAYLRHQRDTTLRVLPEWLKPVYDKGLLVTVSEDNQIGSVTAGDVLTDEMLAQFKSLPKLRELEIGGDSKFTAAGLAHLAELTGLEKLSLSGFNQTENGLADVAIHHVSELKLLREVRLRETGITDAGLRSLEAMPQLKTLDIYQEGRLTNGAIASIAKLTGLKHLSLTSYVGTERWGFMRFSPEALRQLTVLGDLEVLTLPGQVAPDIILAFPKLTSLDMGGSLVDDAVAAKIAGHRALKSLSLSGTRITDEGWKKIATLPELRQLSLRREGITDDGIAHLKGLSKLDHLELRTGSLTDESLGHLAEIKSLTRLELWGGGSTFGGGGSNFTVVGLQQLKGLPKLRTLSLTNLEDAGGYGGLKELTQLRELQFEMATISQQEFNDLEAALPKTRISAGFGWGHLRSIRNPNGL